MSRVFAKGAVPTSQVIHWALAGNTGGSTVGHNQNWAYGTIAAIVNRASGGASGEFPVMLGFLDVGAGREPATFFFSAASNLLGLWIETAGSEQNLASPATVAADGWVLAAVTKTTGAATPRFHHFKFSTGVWTHGNGGATQVDDAFSTADLSIGNGSFSASGFDGHIAMAATWHRRAMSDGEIERLIRGQWGRFHPTFLAEFPDGYDKPASYPNLRGCYRPKGTLLSGTAKATVRGPAGVRYSTPSRGR